MKLHEEKDDLTKKIIANKGELVGYGKYYADFLKKHPTYKSIEAEHNERFKITKKLN